MANFHSFSRRDKHTHTLTYLISARFCDFMETTSKNMPHIHSKDEVMNSESNLSKRKPAMSIVHLNDKMFARKSTKNGVRQI